MKFNQLKTKQSANLAKAGEGGYCLKTRKTDENKRLSANQKVNKHAKTK